MAASKIAGREPEHPNSGNFLRDIVFGANDGLVTAVGFLVGIASSIAHREVIIVAGFLQIFAGATSMALGNYLAVKSQKEYYKTMEKVEMWEMENKPDEEKREIEEIYKNMGFDPEAVKILIKKVTSDKKLWLDVMMKEELGLSRSESGQPIIAGVVIGTFFLLGGIPPLVPFIFIAPVSRALIFSIIISVFVLVCIAAFRWFLNKGDLKAKIMETIAIGMLAALVGFIAGEVLRFFGYNVQL